MLQKDAEDIHTMKNNHKNAARVPQTIQSNQKCENTDTTTPTTYNESTAIEDALINHAEKI